jgi:uncharacterized protein YraI
LAVLLSVASLSAQAQEGYVMVNLNMRAAPDSDYPLITTLEAGSPISVLGCIDDYEWCDVSAYGERGWVSGDYIEYDYQDRRVPLYGYGAQFGVPIISFVIGDYWGSHYNHRPFYRNRDRWYRQPIHYRGSSRHHGEHHGERQDSRRDGYRDARQDNRGDPRPDSRRDARRDTRRSDNDRLDRNQGMRTSVNGNRSAASSTPLVEPRRNDARQDRRSAEQGRPVADRNQRQGRSAPPEQSRQRDKRGARDGADRKRGDSNDDDKGGRDRKDDHDRNKH